MASFYEELQKSEKFSDEIENLQSRAKIDKWIFRLLLLLIGFMPLIVMANIEEVISPLVTNIEELSSGKKGDLFTHYKAIFVLIITIITGAMLLMKVLFLEGTFRKTFLNYVLGLFVVVIVVSTIASPNISIALNGQYNRSDGAISWLCYIALMFIAMNIEYPIKVASYIMYTMMPFVFINLYIITMNFYGKDLLVNNPIIQNFVSLFLPEGANISDGSVLVGTLNQWNYMSGMFAIMTVMYLAWAVTSEKWKEAILGAITASASLAIIFMSMSTGGFLSFLAMLLIIIMVILCKKQKMKSLISLFLFFIISVPIFHVSAEKDSAVWRESIGIFFSNNPYIEVVTTSLIKGNSVYASGNILELPNLPERGYAAGSGRIYIWEKVYNLIEDRILIGYGSDTLIYNFPHYNIDSRSGLMDENTITDKAHNQYISIFYGLGIFGLIAFLLILFTVIKYTLTIFLTKRWAILVFSLTSLTYFSQAMFNDSLPSITAFVFIITGILVSIQSKIIEENKINDRNS